MDYQLFLNEIKEMAAEYFGETYEIRNIQVRKNNGVCQDGLVIVQKGEKVAPAIYLKEYYDKLEQGEELAAVFAQIVETYTGRHEVRGEEAEKILDYDYVRTQMGYRVINYERNRELLKEIPHVRFLDMAVVFYGMLPEFGDESLRASFLIQKKQLSLWDREFEEIYQDALTNCPKMLPEKICSMEQLLLEILGENHPLFGQGEDAPGMYVLTNQKKYYGAACMLYPGVLKEFAGKLKKDLYILPCSIHEVLILPCEEGMTAEVLKSMVCQVNETELSREEILSDEVYYYSRSQDELRIA